MTKNNVAHLPPDNDEDYDDDDLPPAAEAENQETEIPVAVDSQELNEQINDALTRLFELENDRKDTQAKIQSILETMETRGIPKKVLKLVKMYQKLDEPQQQVFDVAYAITRKAIGKPLQMDLIG